MVMANRKARRVTGMENATIQLLSTLVTVVLFVGFRQGLAMEIAPEDWPPILILGLLNTGVGCWLYFSSIGDLPVQTVSVCGYLEPMSAVLFSAVILGEKLLPLQALGAGLILGGALFGELVGKDSGTGTSEHKGSGPACAPADRKRKAETG